MTKGNLMWGKWGWFGGCAYVFQGGCACVLQGGCAGTYACI